MYLRMFVSAWSLFGGAALAQTSTSATSPPEAAPPAINSAPAPLSPAVPPQQSGKIVMYRGSSVVGAALGCPIRFKGREVVELGRGKFAEWDVPPGRYILTNKTSSVEVAVDAGETRHVRCMIKTGMLTGRADLQVVDEESFNEHRSDYERKPVTFTP